MMEPFGLQPLTEILVVCYLVLLYICRENVKKHYGTHDLLK